MKKKNAVKSEFEIALENAHVEYEQGMYDVALKICQELYLMDAYRTENLLLLGAIYFQKGQYSESIFYNQQCIRIDPNFAEAYGNLGNSLREIGDKNGAVDYYLKAIKLKPRFADAYSNLATSYHQSGQIAEAIETYQMALLLNPKAVEAHTNLGSLYKTQGEFHQAKECFTKAIQIQPTYAVAWNNLGGLLSKEGHFDAAVSHFQEAIRLVPEFADAYSNLGNMYKDSGNLKGAAEMYQKAIALRPSMALAHGNLASCMYDMGHHVDAIRMFKHAIQLEPNFPDAYANLGLALKESLQLDEAINCYRTALRLKPDHAGAFNNLGSALQDKGMIKEAIHCFMTAARLMPNFAAAHSNLGSVFKEQGKLDQALAHYQQAVSIDPTFSLAYSNMGNVFKDMNRIEESIKCYTTAIRLQPEFADAYSNLAGAYKDSSRLNDAITCYRKALSLRPNFPEAYCNYVHSLLLICDWRNRDEDFKKLKSVLDKQMENDSCLPSVQPFHALVYPLSMSRFRDISRKFANRCILNVALLEMPKFRFRSKKSNERLRVGYVSSDFGNHPLSHLMQSVFGMHDLNHFEVYCYSLSGPDGSLWRSKIESEVEHFTNINQLQIGDAARLIHNDGIHILINLNGYTKGAKNEIFALQPAPIQISYLGFCGTVGAEYMQYMIGDATVVPPEAHEFYTEKIINMPHCYFVNDHKQSARDVLDPEKCPTRSTYNLPEDKFVFCNFNQVYKIDPTTFITWMNILKRVPNSILWLLRFPPLAEANIRAEAKANGLRVDRLFFTDVAPKDEHLKRGYLADLFLDTPECNAHTTGCDILWSGTPMITLSKERMASRVASSLLQAANLSEMIASTLEEYEELAVALALDMDKLWEIRKKLEENRLTCPLFDTKRWVQNLEAGLVLAWERYQAGLEPHHIDVPDVINGSQATTKQQPSPHNITHSAVF